MRDYRAALNVQKGRRQQVIDRQALLETNLVQLQSDRLDLEQAQHLIQQVAQLTQNELKYQISEIVTLALSGVFDEPYEFDISFEQRRNQTECDLFFVRDGVPIDPLTASGGGAVDVAAFALRVALWALRTNRTQAILILDEPFKFLSEEFKPKATKMIKQISKKLGIQIIMVTHTKEFIEDADSIHEVKIKRGVSYVK